MHVTACLLEALRHTTDGLFHRMVQERERAVERATVVPTPLDQTLAIRFREAERKRWDPEQDFPPEGLAWKLLVNAFYLEVQVQTAVLSTIARGPDGQLCEVSMNRALAWLEDQPREERWYGRACECLREFRDNQRFTKAQRAEILARAAQYDQEAA